MPRLMRLMLALAAALVITGPAARATGIDCDKIDAVYDPLFTSVEARIAAVVKEFHALPADAKPETREGMRRKFCSVAGEAVGLYKSVVAAAHDCAQRGAEMGKVLDTAGQQLRLAEQGVAQCR